MNDIRPASAIDLIDPRTRRAYAAAEADAVVLSSARTGWRSPLVFEVHRMAPHAYAEHVIVGHRLLVNLGAPVPFAWRRGDREMSGRLETGAVCLQSDGDLNAPAWTQEMTFAAVAVTPDHVRTLLEDRTPAVSDTFAERRLVPEATVYGYARALAAELSTPSEPLYAETLGHALVLHLLSAHGGSAAGKRLAPKGKLGARQLQAAAELARERLATDVSLDLLAAACGYSPFQFARMFKATTGWAPHQFVTRLRVERAARLLREDGARRFHASLKGEKALHWMTTRQHIDFYDVPEVVDEAAEQAIDWFEAKLG